VIDMTGPEQRVLSGYHAISGVKKPMDQWEVQKDKKFSNFDLPELLHNLNILVEAAEQVHKNILLIFFIKYDEFLYINPWLYYRTLSQTIKNFVILKID
jgi:hypothetical protein